MTKRSSRDKKRREEKASTESAAGSSREGEMVDRNPPEPEDQVPEVANQGGVAAGAMGHLNEEQRRVAVTFTIFAKAKGNESLESKSSFKFGALAALYSQVKIDMALIHELVRRGVTGESVGFWIEMIKTQICGAKKISLDDFVARFGTFVFTNSMVNVLGDAQWSDKPAITVEDVFAVTAQASTQKQRELGITEGARIPKAILARILYPALYQLCEITKEDYTLNNFANALASKRSPPDNGVFKFEYEERKYTLPLEWAFLYADSDAGTHPYPEAYAAAKNLIIDSSNDRKREPTKDQGGKKLTVADYRATAGKSKRVR